MTPRLPQSGRHVWVRLLGSTSRTYVRQRGDQGGGLRKLAVPDDYLNSATLCRDGGGSSLPGGWGHGAKPVGSHSLGKKACP